MNQYERQIEQIITGCGLTILATRKSKHSYLFTVTGGGKRATVGTSTTPGDHRSTKNFKSRVARLAKAIMVQ